MSAPHADDDVPPGFGGPIRTLSAQRVPIAMHPDGSITTLPPAPPAPPRDPEVVAPTVAAPVSGNVPAAQEKTAATAASLGGLPIEQEALDEAVVTKDPHDDMRPLDVEHLTDKGVDLNAKENLIYDIPKEDVWALVRRFDKQIYHVRQVPVHNPNRLDLTTAPNDQFSPDKLRAQLERFYLTVVLGVVAFTKHMTRLMWWTEPGRSAAFCAAYFIAWFFNLLVPAILTLLAILITVPPARRLLFPPARLTVIDHTGGNRPASPEGGEAHAADTLTGAPEAQKGEAAEKEASNFVGGLAQVAVGVASGTGPSEKSRDHDDDTYGLVPDPTEVAARATDAIGTAEQGTKHHTKADKTKQPMQNAMWEQTKPLMHGLSAACDTWERLANALSPTPPFHKNRARMRLAALLVPMIIGIPFVSYNLVFKGLSFAIGAGFFGFPWIQEYSQQGLRWLNENYPDWPQKLDLGQSILRGVPTNAQLTLTLLRIAEAEQAPLPPPPTTSPPPTGEEAPPPAQGAGPQFDKDDNSSDTEDTYIHANVSPVDGSEPGASSSPPKKGARARLAGLLRGTARLGAETVEVTHRVKAATTGGARDKVGVLPPKLRRGHGAVDGPDVFFARHHGRKGHVALARGAAEDPGATVLSFRRGREDGSREEDAPRVEITVGDIAELRKVGGLGWKGKLVAGWALGEDVPDGLEVTTRDGQRELFTAMPRRDELFDRLIAMSAQRWECL